MKLLLAALRGSFASVVLAANVLVVFSLMVPVALVKLLLPFAPVRRVTDRWLNNLATGWIAVNNLWIALVNEVRWDVELPAGLDPRGWYLVASNHQSWADILVLQRVFTRRIPFLKFFLKRELLYVPVIGLAWWALDFPFMHRKGGSAGRDDLERTRRACEKFRHVPTSVINFLEGTRFTRAKHDAQNSPFRHLLKPKVGGIAIALATLGDRFDAVLDVTIAYPGGAPTFWQVLSGGLTHVVVRVRRLPLPVELAQGDYARDPAARGNVQRWVNALWKEKDGLIDATLRQGGN
jgi:1-acyl-sn-glycerol-3-phosphate acyltransferase